MKSDFIIWNFNSLHSDHC